MQQFFFKISVVFFRRGVIKRASKNYNREAFTVQVAQNNTIMGLKNATKFFFQISVVFFRRGVIKGARLKYIRDKRLLCT